MSQVPPMKKRSFIRSADPPLINYNWADVASGVGYVEYYGLGMEDGSHILTTAQLIAGTREYSSPSGNYPRSSYFSTVDTVTFELSPFVIKQVIEGNAIITYSTSHGAGSSSSDLKFHFYKNDTLLVTADVRNDTLQTANSYNAMVTIPKTIFGIGDQLKIVAEVTADESFYLYHDPSDTPASEGGSYMPDHTVLKFAIPYRINL